MAQDDKHKGGKKEYISRGKNDGRSRSDNP